MDINWIKTFCISAETLNFRKTSELLHMSQPNVTVHIRKLEESLGVALFTRKQNRVHLTPEGLLFYKNSKVLLDNFTHTVQSVQALAQGFRKKWTLAISPLLAETILPSLVRQFLNDHPDVEFQIRVEESTDIEKLVESGEVDFGLSAMPPTNRKLVVHTLFSEDVVFVRSIDSYDEESGPPLDAEEILTSETLFTHHHPVIWEDLTIRLRHAVPGIRAIKVSQASITKRLVQDGLGVSFLPHSIVRRELLEGRLVTIPFPLFDLPKVSTYAVVQEEGELEQAFLKAIQNRYFG
ncbi:LysR family transcriptional regulator [Chryseomicrobium aureum]|uniref:LysR family transcriptional regulator n=1 Tax=Chryseomicrobium aureum TaxID=1441723 RepID=UPI00370D893B